MLSQVIIVAKGEMEFSIPKFNKSSSLNKNMNFNVFSLIQTYISAIQVQHMIVHSFFFFFLEERQFY